MPDVITFEVKGLKKMKLDFLTPSRYNRAMMSAINTSTTAHRKASVNEAAKIFKLPKNRIKTESKGPTTRIKRARIGNLSATIFYSSKRPGLQWYATRRTNPKRGNPKFKIQKSRALKPLERGFFQTVKGGLGLWQREGKARYPIHRRTGPGIRQMYLHKPIRDKLEPALFIMLDARFQAKLSKFQK